jgi:hypothetical protein
VEVQISANLIQGCKNPEELAAATKFCTVLTSRSRGFPDKLTGAQLVRKFLAFYGI